VDRVVIQRGPLRAVVALVQLTANLAEVFEQETVGGFPVVKERGSPGLTEELARNQR